jgi:hypothetical protein
MKLPRSSSIRAYFLQLLVTATILVFSVSSVHAKLVTFRYEGQLSSVDSALSDSFLKGDTFSGMYTFETTLTDFDDYFDGGDGGTLVNSISAMSFSSGVYSTSVTEPVIRNWIYSSQQGYGYRDKYRVSVSMDSEQSLGAGYLPDNVDLFWVANKYINWSAEKLSEQILPETPGHDGFLGLGDYYDGPVNDRLLDEDGIPILLNYDSFEDYFKDNPERPVFFYPDTDEQFFPSDRVKYNDGWFSIRNGTMDFSFINEDQTSANVSGFLTSVTVVPIPATVWLFGTGLLGLFGWKQHRNM